ncbi:hypothetical protein ARMSODRAFT_982579 [Armillaria solidipes]|uniref:Uncharacterized protein n=1 Tax=Armillaria solidipes TaxID=1076256 RepID=A0A2H3B5Y0_9AGAR|nr:hypothetical protein ARMSODRAFT_982579 [Armillaria solidipes]
MQDLCLAVALRWAPHPSLMLSDVLTTVKVDFQILAYLGVALAYYGKWRGDESADKDDAHFERGRDKKAWSGISADGHYPPLAAFLQRRSEGREWIAVAIQAREWSTPG